MSGTLGRLWDVNRMRLLVDGWFDGPVEIVSRTATQAWVQLPNGSTVRCPVSWLRPHVEGLAA